TLDVARDQILLEGIAHTHVELLLHHLFANMLKAVDDDGADRGAVELRTGLTLRIRPRSTRQPDPEGRRDYQPGTTTSALLYLVPRDTHAERTAGVMP